MNVEQDTGNQAKGVPPRWMYLGLTIGGAWASGLYLGQATQTGFSTDLILRTALFGLFSLLMAWGALRSG
jgi:hypothetical protein